MALKGEGQMTSCPCDSRVDYANCCGRYINTAIPAPTAEALMRSRYTAYTRNDVAYLSATWHPSTHPENLSLDDQPAPKWLGLSVMRHEQQDDSHAIVEFIARYKINGRAFKLHETSRFVREKGQWLYLDGDMD